VGVQETAKKYGRTFTLMDKVDVNGPDAAPVFKDLLNAGSNIKWNFEKYLISRDGEVVGHFESKVIGAGLEKELVSKL
jgi:glutathione peroxidase